MKSVAEDALSDELRELFRTDWDLMVASLKLFNSSRLAVDLHVR